jgi:EmrB/QacA subfamily drug resistance transporter
MKTKKLTGTTEKRVALLVAALTAFLTPFMGSAVNVALPAIGRDFGANAILLSWVASAYLLMAAVFLVPFGRLADIMGRKKIFVAGILIFSGASFLCAAAPSAMMLIVFRVFQALGSAMIFATGVAIITSVFPVGERGAAMGITVASTYAGLSIGPFVGGILTAHLGWRSIFGLTVPLGLAVAYLTVKKFKGEWAEAKGEAFDWPGAVVYGISLIFIMYGFSLLPGLTGAILILSGLVGIVVFIGRELKIDHPVLDIRLFKLNRVFTFSNLAALIHYSATFGVSFLLSLYLQYIKGLSPQQAGLILVAQPVVMALFSPLMGRLSDRIEPRLVASIGMAITFVGLCPFVFLTNKTSLTWIMGNLMLLGLGFAFFSSPNTNAVMSSVARRSFGIASATVATMRVLGQMFSMGIAMLLFALFIGRAEIRLINYPQFLVSVKTAFTIFALLCFVGIFFSLARGRVSRRDAP